MSTSIQKTQVLSIHRGWQVVAGLLKKPFFPWKSRPVKNSICQVEKQFFLRAIDLQVTDKMP
jgi:hypothetical protein